MIITISHSFTEGNQKDHPFSAVSLWMQPWRALYSGNVYTLQLEYCNRPLRFATMMFVAAWSSLNGFLENGLIKFIVLEDKETWNSIL